MVDLLALSVPGSKMDLAMRFLSLNIFFTTVLILTNHHHVDDDLVKDFPIRRNEHVGKQMHILSQFRVVCTNQSQFSSFFRDFPSNISIDRKKSSSYCYPFLSIGMDGYYRKSYKLRCTLAGKLMLASWHRKRTELS